MCYQVVERYAVCRCLYHKHAIDPCAQYGRQGHAVQEKTVLVGYACNIHTNRCSLAASSSSIHNGELLTDSGYSSLPGFNSCITHHRHRRFPTFEHRFPVEHDGDAQSYGAEPSFPGDGQSFTIEPGWCSDV